MIKQLQSKIDNIYYVANSINVSDRVDLFSGKCGLAVFNFYYAKYKNDQEAYEKGYNEINEIFDIINSGFNHYTFSTGLAGIGWCIEHLSENDFLDVDTNSLFNELDAYLFEKMIEEINTPNYDYLHGAMGIALYFLKLKKSSKDFWYLEQLIDNLYSLSEKDINDGIKWKSVIDRKSGRMGYDISVSHGISSIIAILSKIYKIGIRQGKIKKMIEGAVKYLMQQKLSKDVFISVLPNRALESSFRITPSRLAWCYGDLGISTALWHASQTLERRDWEKESIALLLHSIKRRNLTKNMVFDAGLCHGTAGIAHIFNRMYSYTGLEELKEASVYWFDQTLKMASFEDGLAGYKAWQGTERGWVNNPGLLEGIAGIGLAMISAVSDIDPAWDECLLLS